MRGFSAFLRNSGITTVVVERRLSYLKPVEASEHDKVPLRRSRGSVYYPVPFIISLFPMLFFSFSAMVEVLRLHRRQRFSLLYAQDFTFAGISSVIAGTFARVPVIVQVHAFPLEMRDQRFTLRRVVEFFTIRLVSMLARCIIVNNASIGDYFGSLSIPKAKTLTIPLGVDLSHFAYDPLFRADVRTKLGLADDEIIIGFVGGFRSEKNIESLIEAFYYLLTETPNIATRLVLVGSGVLETSLKHLVADRGIQSKVLFLGFRHDINVLMSAFDILVLPSFFETFSLVLVEGMACARAVVASNISSIRDKVRDGQSALLVNPSDVMDIERAISLLVNNSALRVTLGQNAEHDSKKYSIDQTFQQILRICEATAA